MNCKNLSASIPPLSILEPDVDSNSTLMRPSLGFSSFHCRVIYCFNEAAILKMCGKTYSRHGSAGHSLGKIMVFEVLGFYYVNLIGVLKGPVLLVCKASRVVIVCC